MALVSTSSNRSGDEPIRSYREAVKRFKGEVDFILPGTVGDAPAPTPIRDANSDLWIRTG
jgi:tRNA A37 threonylcarbamoyladenosine synthetase subunit TsaC/SUA5/YrdC